jgi:hypothetical protein
MLLRQPRRSGFFPVLKVFVAIEIAVAGASYLVWNRMNTNQSFRKYMRDSYPSILDGYYKLGETLDSTNRTRSFDSKVWELEENLKK